VHFVVAECNGKIAGCGFGQILDNPDECSKIKKFAYVRLIYVSDEFRGKGIATLIIDDVIKWLKSKGIVDIRLNVYSQNTGAMNLYKKLGFEDFMLEMQYKR